MEENNDEKKDSSQKTNNDSSVVSTGESSSKKRSREEQDDPDVPSNHNNLDKNDSPSTPLQQSASEDDNEPKSHTFRRRRLSMPKHHVEDAVPERKRPRVGEPDNHHHHHSAPRGSPNHVGRPGPPGSSHGPPPPPPHHKQEKRPSMWQHSAEMLSGPLSPVVRGVLYEQTPLPPTQVSALQHAQPPHSSPRRRNSRIHRRQSWKQRHTLTDEATFPFPTEIVGTYSCHGVEPIYDSDYDEEEEEEEEEEEGLGNLLADDLDDSPKEEKTGEAPAAAADSDNAIPANAIHSSLVSQGKVFPPPDGESSGWSPATSVSESPQQGEHKPPPPPPPPPVCSRPVVRAAAANNNTTKKNDDTKANAGVALSAKINQDRGGIFFPYANCRKTALFAVYDGHGQGGELVSQFALHEIQVRLQKHPKFATDLKAAFQETFLGVDDALKQEPIIDPYFAGTTACVALLQDRLLTLANVGDSRAVLARRAPENGNNNNNNRRKWKLEAVDLTEDQNPDTPDEMQRIVNAGGYVSPPAGPGLSARVWLDAEWTQIGLAMARSIGDHAVSEIGVIAEPVVTQYEVRESDEFMIVASDGVWEFLSSRQAIDIVGRHLFSRGATVACQALIEAAAEKWHQEEGEYRDDITAIVIRLPQLWRNQERRHQRKTEMETAPDAARA